MCEFPSYALIKYMFHEEYSINIFSDDYLLLFAGPNDRVYIVVDNDVYYIIKVFKVIQMRWCIELLIRGDVQEIETFKFLTNSTNNVVVELENSKQYFVVSGKLFSTESFVRKCILELKSKNININLSDRINKLNKFPDDTMFFIQSYGYVGNSLNLWAEGSSGYTTNPLKAQQYTKAEILSYLKNNRSQDNFWVASEILDKKSYCVDSQHLDYSIYKI